MRHAMFVASRAGDRRLGHGEGRADLALEQRVQPPLLLLGGAEHGEDLHVPGVGRRAVARLGGERRAAHDLGERRVVEVRQAVGPLGLVGQEEVPQAPGPRASALSSSITGGWKCGSPDSPICSWYTASAGYTCSSMNPSRVSWRVVEVGLSAKSMETVASRRPALLEHVGGHRDLVHQHREHPDGGGELGLAESRLRVDPVELIEGGGQVGQPAREDRAAASDHVLAAEEPDARAAAARPRDLPGRPTRPSGSVRSSTRTSRYVATTDFSSQFGG